MKILTNDEFYQKVKDFILWEVFHKTRGQKISFAAYDLTKDQSYFFGRVCAELALRHVGAATTKDDGIRNKIEKIIEQEDQLIYGA